MADYEEDSMWDGDEYPEVFGITHIIT